MGSKFKSFLRKEQIGAFNRGLVIPFIMVAIGVYKLFMLVPSDKDKLIVHGEVEYVSYVRNKPFKSVGVKSTNGYYIKLQNNDRVYEVYFLKDCEKLSAFKEEPKEAKLLVDNKRSSVLQLEINGFTIFEYDLWYRILPQLWWIGIGLVLAILSIFVIIYRVKGKITVG